MSKGFFNGLLMGAITGTLFGVFLNPQLKTQHRKKINHISHDNGIRENRE